MSNIDGSIVALPTPWNDDALDLSGLEQLVAFQARHATSMVRVGGFVGEAWSLTLDEVGQLVSRAVEVAAERSSFRLRVAFGVVEPDSRRARDQARAAVNAGADAIFVTPTAVTGSSELSLVRHFAAIASGVRDDVPLVFSNEPRLAGADVTAETVSRVASEVPSIVAHCEGRGRPARARDLAERLSIPHLCADDRMIGPYLRGGAVGAVTTVGNLVPGEVARFIEANVRGGANVDSMERALLPLVDTLEIAATPVALKAALAALGPIESEVRPPLVPLSDQERRSLEQSLTTARLLVPTTAPA